LGGIFISVIAIEKSEGRPIMDLRSDLMFKTPKLKAPTPSSSTEIQQVERCYDDKPESAKGSSTQTSSKQAQ